MNTKKLCISIMFAVIYVALTVVFRPISFLQIQVRVANLLLALIPLFGFPSVIGISLGVGIANLGSPLGLIDMISVVPTFLGAVVIYKVSQKSVLVGLILYNLIIASWLVFMLNFLFSVPILVTYLHLIVGLSIANIGIGYPTYKVLKRVYSVEKK